MPKAKNGLDTTDTTTLNTDLTSDATTANNTTANPFNSYKNDPTANNVNNTVSSDGTSNVNNSNTNAVNDTSNTTASSAPANVNQPTNTPQVDGANGQPISAIPVTQGTDSPSRDLAKEANPSAIVTVIPDDTSRPVQLSAMDTNANPANAGLNIGSSNSNNQAQTSNDGLPSSEKTDDSKSANVNPNPVNPKEVVYNRTIRNAEKMHEVISNEAIAFVEQAHIDATRAGDSAHATEIHNALVALGDFREKIRNGTEKLMQLLKEAIAKF